MASTLTISLPSRVAAQSSPDWSSQTFPFALFSAEGNILQQGLQTLTELRALSVGARQLHLLLAASDVSLLTIKVPPMSAAKFKTALPNLLEEQLTSDPADVALVATPVVNGEATVAVADRAWLETIAAKVKDWPVKKIAAFPSQLALTLPGQENHAAALIENRDGVLALTIRQSELQGMGLNLAEAERDSAIAMLNLLAPETNVELYVGVNEVEQYQALLQTLALNERFQVRAISWQNRVGGISLKTLDLMSDVGAIHKPSIDWSLWRWPLRLLAVMVILNIAALNMEWFSLKREARNLSAALMQTYKNSFPKETTIPDPLVQMRQKVDLAKRLSGQFAPNDFAVMAAQFTQVWERVMLGKPADVVSVEYKDRGLNVKVKSPGQIPLDQLRGALAEQSMHMEATPDGILHITMGGKN